ncbi:MAG: erythrose-4-phosphate dehydrogenase, partial [Burkholderiales bacterium]|nr:erythrose-4-phosphate dehydrogenase [Burkholderiales bacterium]
PLKDLDVDVLLECTGAFRYKDILMQYIQAGAKKVLLACPGKNMDATIVYGVNQNILTPKDIIVSNASCTTNCLAPYVKPILDKIGIVDGLLTTVHAYTNDQVLTDVKHKDLRRARAASMNIIPTKTGAAKAVGEVIPELKGKMDGFAMRVPTINVSVCDLTFTAGRPTTEDEINKVIKDASETPELKGILGYNTLPLVSSDFNHTPYSSIFDATLTKVINGNLVKAVAWYDNEWGFSCRMLDTATAMYNAK